MLLLLLSKGPQFKRRDAGLGDPRPHIVAKTYRVLKKDEDGILLADIYLPTAHNIHHRCRLSATVTVHYIIIIIQ